MLAFIFNPATLYGLLAGGAAVFAEYLYRTLDGTAIQWVESLWMWIFLQLIISYGIYKLVNLPGLTLIDSLIVFSSSTILLRVILTVFVLGDVVKTGTWIALGLLLLARVVQSLWK